MADGHLDPEYPITKIVQKGTFRTDLGDLDELVDSIDRLGLLTPFIVTAEGGLISGKRRLSAARQLGWDTIPAWTPVKVSKQLRMRAICDDQMLAKPLTPIEQANLYGEYEKIYIEEAKLRQKASRFTTTQPVDPESDTKENTLSLGAGESPAPQPASQPDTRVKAAEAVTGTDSHQRLEQIRELQAIAADPTQHPLVQEDAMTALAELNMDGKVNPRWQRVKINQHLTALDLTAADPSKPDDARQVAATTATAARQQTDPATILKTTKAGVKEVTRLIADAPKPAQKPVDPHAIEKREVHLLLNLLRREHGWWDRIAKGIVATYADDTQWDFFASYIEPAYAFYMREKTLREETTD